MVLFSDRVKIIFHRQCDSDDESKKIFEKNSEYIIILIVFCEQFQFVDV